MISEMPANRVAISLTRTQHKMLLEDSIAVPPELLDKLRWARVEQDAVTALLSLEDLDLLLDAVAAEANHADSPTQEKTFEEIYDQLREVLYAHISPEGGPSSAPTGDPLSRELEQALAGLDMTRHEDVQATVAQVVEEYNLAPMSEMGGLSPSQAFDLIHSGWWEEPHPVQLNSDLPFSDLGAAVFVTNARMFLKAIDEAGGAPATAKGNLTRQFVSQMLEHLDLPKDCLRIVRAVNRVINEHDVWPLHVLRGVCELGGVVEKQKKRFTLTRVGKEMMPNQKAGELYRHLFDVFFRKFNLAYLDRAPEGVGIQSTFPYILYRLRTLSDSETYTVEELAPLLFLPKVQEELHKKSSHEHMPEWVLEMRVLKPLEGFGLVKIERVDPNDRAPSLIAVRKTPLFERFVELNLDQA